jgi:putative transposase
MPNYRRLYVPGGTYFFTVNLRDRRSRLLVEHIDDLRAAYAYVAARHPFTTVAVCVLPEHLHCLWTLPADDRDFSTRWRLIKTEFSRAIPKTVDAHTDLRDGERGIWQRRFWEHLIRDERDFDAHLGYIHFNPVKHGHVTNVDDWPHSSWHRFKREYGHSADSPPEELEAGER